MSGSHALLLIPVENQVRELDPKLLLACIAARHGFASIIGSRREMELSIDSFPRAIYLSKSMTIRSLLFFQIARRLGHKIVAWDEEALVHLPPETYFSRRLNALSIKYVSSLFAWGQDNVELWRQYPHLPADTPIHAIGNPRGDMLRSEIRAFYQKDAEALRNTHGNFILVNTNFNHVNAFGPDMNLFKPVSKPGRKARFGRSARGMSREYASGLADHKQAVFSHFRKLIPELEQAFPDYRIVVRPHPTENHEVYHRIAANCQRVRVTNEGNIVPWLMATRALIHNGCTTGVEAYLVGVPAISYRATINADIDDGFYRLPNRLSHECFGFEELQATLQKILDGDLGVANTCERRMLINRYLSAQDGPLACERLIDVLKGMTVSQAVASGQAGFRQLERWLLTKGLQVARRFKSSLPGTHNRPEFQHHRYPEIPVEDIRTRIARLQGLLGDSRDLTVEQLSDVSFRISV
jgi:surface carbohydrate biosynthesis protein